MGKYKQRGGNYKKESEEMSERKYAITEMKNAFDLFISNENIWWQNQWAWTQIDRNLPEWNAKRKKQKENIEQNIQELWDHFKRCFLCLVLEYQKEKQEQAEKNTWS